MAANNFYREQTDPFSISQRDETHTVALGYRRGFTLGRLPRVEFGGQIQLHERDSGFLNGFIAGFERPVGLDDRFDIRQESAANRHRLACSARDGR